MKKRITLALLSLLLVPLGMMAQSVTVDPTTGKLIAAKTYEQEVGFENGWSAMWRHEQLPMSFTVADDNQLTPSGEIANPAGNISVNNGNLVIMGGVSADLYCVLSLPNGYRFKGYKIVFLNNLNGVTVNNMPIGYNRKSGGTFGEVRKIVYETDDTYNTSSYKARGYYSDSQTTYQMRGRTQDNSSTREYVITRMSETTDDMGNQLYFRVAHSNRDCFFGLTIKSFTVYFTAEGTFEAEAKPISTDVALSMVRSPFKTNKMDIGKLDNVEKNGKTYFAYTYTNVHDIDGYTYIYQDDAHAGGIPMNVATKKKINPVTIGSNKYYAFENGTYYVEAPTQVYSQTGLSYPVGYRIVGAKFTPQWGSKVTGDTENRTLYYITYKPGEVTYYLNDQLHFTETKFGWYYDSETKNVYVGTGDDAQYLACEGSGGDRTLTYSITNGGYYNLSVSDDGTEIGWPSSGYYLRGTTNASATVHMTNDANTNDHAKVSSGTESVTLASYNPGAFTLNVYDKTGTTVQGTASVTASGSGAGTPIDLSAKSYGYNNDAIKFEITGLQEGHHALVDVSVFMQALNPYIDQMNIVCHDPSNTIELSQPFNAENFRVSGGQIKFNIPSGYTGNLNFTFKDLYSQYGDNTYYTGTSLQKDGYARYSFVTSPYFSDFDGDDDGGLYDENYVGTATNVQPGAKIAYNTKVYAEKAGNIRFKFNNAENLSNVVTSGTRPNYLEEYPFSVANYVGSTNPDGSGTGAFVDCTMNASDTESSTYYIFTADETRYNIAPSYNWQHRYYAFYRMEIDLQTDTYVPQLTWTKVYDETCYNKNGSAAYDGMWGLKLRTVKEGSTTPVEGYLTVKEISDAIQADLGKDNCPTAKDQVIYVDAGDLHTIQNSTVTSGGQTTTMDIGTLQQTLSKNVLIYLPESVTSIYDNCAKKTSNWTTGDPYYATRDIVLTDNVPFYAPYDIYVDVDNVIKHERKITVQKNGKVTSASIIMPFDILIDENGKHTNLDGQQFTLHQMKSSGCLTTGTGADFAYFPVVSGVSKAPANKPYLVQVIDVPDGDQISFVLSQKGGTIKATRGSGYVSDETNIYKYTYPGETGSGTKDGVNYTFTNHGSYSGKLLAKSGNFFYYWKNQFVRSNDYSYNADIKIAPFRAYYSSVTTSNGAKTLQLFDVLFEDGNETDGITTVGEIENIDMNAPVYDLQGRKLANSLLNSRLGKGVYVINGVKIIIK
jgi:hypothetical protein